MANFKAIAKFLVCWLWRLPRLLAIELIRFYQRGISPLIGPRCKYHPTCSQYFIEAVEKYGFLAGAARGTYRLLRCNPWSRGGIDPP